MINRLEYLNVYLKIVTHSQVSKKKCQSHGWGIENKTLDDGYQFMSQISSAKVKSRILEAKIPYGTVFPEKKYPRAVDTHQLIRKTGIQIDIEISLKTKDRYRKQNFML